jgi:CubicO group peptidase (beta-lactamase class C family)
MTGLIDDRRRDAFAQRISNEVERGVLVGAVIGIGDREGSTELLAFGSAGTLDAPEVMRADHRFLLTSVTKPFTAMQVLQLAAEGALDLDAPVAYYLPEFAVNGKDKVTSRQLLSHTSGLDVTSYILEGPESAYGPGEHLQAALTGTLNFMPGSRWQYCSTAFWVLAELVSRMSGMSYIHHLERRICEPLGMRDTRYEPGDDVPERYVPVRNGSNIAETDYVRRNIARTEYVRRIAYPAGGLVGTADDLLKFGRSFIAPAGESPSILSATCVSALWRTWAEGWHEGRHVRWSLGWALGGPGTFRSDRTLFHSGGSGTAMWVDSENGVVVVLLTATQGFDSAVYGQVINGALGSLRCARRPSSNRAA